MSNMSNMSNMWSEDDERGSPDAGARDGTNGTPHGRSHRNRLGRLTWLVASGVVFPFDQPLLDAARGLGK